MKIAFVNHRFVAEDEATVSIHDRGFLYGDGLFETIRVAQGRPLLWERHLCRLTEGLAHLAIPMPTGISPESLHGVVLQLLERNTLTDAVVRIAVSRGPGRRGYSPREAGPSTWIVTTHPGTPLDAPPSPPRRLAVSRFRLGTGDPLTSLKTASRLLNVLARAEAEERGADDALLLNDQDRLAEAGSANLFWFGPGGIHTPPLSEGALPGITRGFVLETARDLGWSATETAAPLAQLFEAGGVFLTFATAGMVEVQQVDDRRVSLDPRFVALRSDYLARLRGPNS